MKILIRSEKREDIQVIRPLITTAFAHAQHSDGNEAEIVDKLRDDGALTLSLVAEKHTLLVGHIAVSPIELGENKDWFAIAPLSVLPDHQSTGIGSYLMVKVIKHFKKNKAAGLVLVGDPGYYQRFGFHTYSGITVAGIPEEYVLVLPFGRTAREGQVRYHSAFGLPI